LLLTKQADR